MASMPAALPALPERLIHADADRFLQASLAHCQTQPAAAQWSVDASALQQFDSSVLAVLLALRRALLAQGAVLVVHGLPTRLRELATLYGVAELLPA
jgi:phospholipid transport system transporter-binding protein